MQVMSLVIMALVGIQGALAGNGGSGSGVTSGTSAADCSSTQFWVSDTRSCANCVQSTGVCADSSCTVFGYPNSAKANCNGQQCPNSYCSYYGSCKITDGKQCFGLTMCSDGSTTCDGYGALCLQDGSSGNFKICGSSTLASPSPSPLSCSVISAKYKAESQSVGLPCTPTFTSGVLSKYNCTEIAPGCGEYTCANPIATDVASKLAQCQS